MKFEDSKSLKDSKHLYLSFPPHLKVTRPLCNVFCDTRFSTFFFIG